MKRFCAWHNQYYPEECDSRGDYFIGIKEPIENTERTDGICPDCEKIVMKEIQGIKTAHTPLAKCWAWIREVKERWL